MTILSELYDNFKQEPCAFWVGAGISRDSGAPCADQLSNSILYSLCKYDKNLFDIIYNQQDEASNPSLNPINLTLPWKYSPSNIFINSSYIQIENPEERTFLRLETILESIRQCIPNQLPRIFELFDHIEPNTIHFILASALAKGHHVITTNWDRLIEKAASILKVNFEVKTWNSATEKIVSEGLTDPNSGILLKLHGCVSKPEELITFIHQYIWGVPQEIHNFLNRILKNRLLICLGYSFSDYFDYNEIFQKLFQYSSRLFVVRHSQSLKRKNDWKKLDSHDKTLKGIKCDQKIGIHAYTKSFIKWLCDEDKEWKPNLIDITKKIVNNIDKCSVLEKRTSLFWLLVLLGKTNTALNYFYNPENSKFNFEETYWANIIALAQAYYLEGKLKRALNLFNNIMKNDYKNAPIENMVNRLELLDRGCEIALSNLSYFKYIRLLRKAVRIYKYNKIRYSTMSLLQQKELEIRFKHLFNNIISISKKSDMISRFFIISVLDFFSKEMQDFDSKKSLKETPKEFFLLDVKLNSDRSQALKERKYDTVASCYKSYVEMCDIDGSLGALIDLAVYVSGVDYKKSLILLNYINLNLKSNTGSIYASVKYNAVFQAINFMKEITDFNFKTKCKCLLRIIKLCGNIKPFDTISGKILWFIFSSIFFLRTVRNMK